MRHALLLVGIASAVIACGTILGASGEDEAPPSGNGGGSDASASEATTSNEDASGSSDGALTVDGAVVDGGDGSLRVFITAGANTRTGTSLASDIDTFCQGLATSAKLGGKWISWLSYDKHEMGAVIVDDGPWKTLNGDLVAANKSELLSGKLAHAIDRDQFNVYRIANVWSGTYSDGGLNALATCNGWKANTGYIGAYGRAGVTDEQWSNWMSGGCTTFNAVYCFEIR